MGKERKKEREREREREREGGREGEREGGRERESYEHHLKHDCFRPKPNLLPGFCLSA